MCEREKVGVGVQEWESPWQFKKDGEVREEGGSEGGEAVTG